MNYFLVQAEGLKTRLSGPKSGQMATLAVVLHIHRLWTWGQSLAEANIGIAVELGTYVEFSTKYV